MEREVTRLRLAVAYFAIACVALVVAIVGAPS